MVPRRRELACFDGLEHVAELPLHRGLVGQYVVKRGTQAVDVGPWAEILKVALSLLGAHEAGRSQGTAGKRFGGAAGGAWDECLLAQVGTGVGPTCRLGQPPVDHQRLTVLADDDVAGLDVAMEHAAAVRVLDGVADVEKSEQQFTQFERALAGVGR